MFAGGWFALSAVVLFAQPLVEAELLTIDTSTDSAISDNRRGKAADCVESLLELLSVLFAVLFRIPAERT